VPPALDLQAEAALQKLLVESVAEGLVESAHDCAEGGVAVAVSECCFDAGLGASVDVPPVDLTSAERNGPAAAVGLDEGWVPLATLFGESASRVVVSARPESVAALLARAAALKVPAAVAGRVGGDRVRLNVGGQLVVDEPVQDLQRLWESAIDIRFEAQRATA
jgi:phosphoribosylformylglycinamidine synthase